MGTPEKNESKGGFFAAMTSGISKLSNAMHRSVNGYFLFSTSDIISFSSSLRCFSIGIYLLGGFL